MRRLLTKMSVDRCALTSSSRRGWIADQIDWRGGGCDAGPLGISSSCPIRLMSSTGTSIRSSSFFFADVSTIVTPRYAAAAVSPTANSAWIDAPASFTPSTCLPLFP